jgi:hypothetical protein
VSLLVAILTLALVAVVFVVVSAPLRARAGRRGHEGAGPAAEPEPGGPADLERDDLEAAREAKYREIRDAELDYRTGKLSREDYQAIDGALRAEAIEILNRLEGSEPELSPRDA